jgi:hypothetical protein
VTTDAPGLEEQFGRWCHHPVKDAQEAVAANQSEYGLQSAIFTRNIDAALGIAHQLEVGSVQINGKSARGPDHFPFVGIKASGMGAQGVRYSIESMTRTKAIVFNLHEWEGFSGCRLNAEPVVRAFPSRAAVETVRPRRARLLDRASL